MQTKTSLPNTWKRVKSFLSMSCVYSCHNNELIKNLTIAKLRLYLAFHETALFSGSQSCSLYFFFYLWSYIVWSLDHDAFHFRLYYKLTISMEKQFGKKLEVRGQYLRIQWTFQMLVYLCAQTNWLLDQAFLPKEQSSAHSSLNTWALRPHPPTGAGWTSVVETATLLKENNDCEI